MKKNIDKYDLIKSFGNDVISIIELISVNPYQVALRFVLEEVKTAKTWEIPYIHGRIIQWDINETSLNSSEENFIKDEFKKASAHDLLDMVTADMAIKFDDYNLASIMRIRIVEQVLFYYKLSTRDFSKREKTFDLFEIVTKNKLHPNFQNLLHPKYKLVREVLESWTEGFEDRDNKFAKQFQETFNSMFWELYLYQCLRVLKMDIDFSKQSPDFAVKSPYGNEFIIEAVITNGTEGDKHHYEKDKKRTYEELINFASVRILNSICEKYKHYMGIGDKYKKSKYVDLEHVKGKPFVIALAPFEQNAFFIQNNQAINLVLYGQRVKTKINEDKEVTAKFINIDKIQKNEKTLLDVGLFTNDKYKEISAVIFSTTATFSKAVSCSDAECIIQANTFHIKEGRITNELPNEMYFESLLDGLQIHRNPFAAVPLDLTEFSNYEISSYTYNPLTETVIVNQNNNTLVSRISKWSL
ncbi:MAG: hypothetical protein ACERKK_12740 [Poseidonibacter sp.]|uniref:hypothetical protein n=1 Tax=Poseidonibacter sp. TaxID=2321188 RepID=UPI00359CCD9E